MTLIVNKSRALKPKVGRVIKNIGYVEQKGIDMVKEIAKSFGEQSKKQKPKKMYFR
jgi:hypothetical protein